MLVVESLSRSFGSLKAVDEIGFQVKPGEIYGLLGPNGAGKTTTISCVCGLLRPDRGTIELDGVALESDPIAFKRRLGVVPQETALYGDLSARENLHFWGGLAGLTGGALRDRTTAVLEAVGLTERAGDAVRKYSGGMKRRLNLAIGMIHEPKLLLLDEPTVGIDIQARLNILDVVREVVRAGTIVLYTTHYLEEAQELCDRIGIMDHGRILAEGSLTELKRMVGEGEILTLKGRFEPGELQSIVAEDEHVRVVSLEEGQAVLDVGKGQGEVTGVLGRILRKGLAVDDISIQQPNLQGVFLKLTGRELRD
ncbi:MAG: ABC transporter ATP-binding protein [Candidatus Eisenbacteria sp.]|nr:ABC transporter ATP-binding protein [Candidatus Eisenbacteria bacterium]